MHSELVIGVDGGGTKTVAWLALQSADHAVLGRGQAGPSNPRAVGFEVAQSNIDAAIDAAFADARLPRGSVASACLCLAGAGRFEEQARLTEWSRQRGLATITRVTGDAEPILAAASPENWGIALISGTGSFAWGRNREGQTGRSGGWGYLLGDEGSAYAIAIAGLRAAARAADERSAPTDLLPAFCERLQCPSAADLISRIYSPAMTRERIAELADVVFAVSARDGVGKEIISAAAGELATLVSTLASRLRLPVGQYPLALAGGVLCGQPVFRELIAARLTHLNAAAGPITLVTEPVLGAVALSRKTSS